MSRELAWMSKDLGWVSHSCITFVAAFGQMLRAIIRFVTCLFVCLSVRLHGTVRLPLDGNFMSEYFSKILYEYLCTCGSTVVKVLCYKPEVRWFDPKWCQWIFRWHKILPIALWPREILCQGIFRKFYMNTYVRAVEQWLRRCVTNRKVAGSIPNGVSGFFIDK